MTKPNVYCHEAQYWPAATPVVHKFDYDALAAERDELQAALSDPFRLARHSKRLVEQLRDENTELRTALAATDKLASEAAQRNEDLGRRVRELEEALRKINMRVAFFLEDQLPMDEGSLDFIQIMTDEILCQQAKP